MVLSGFVQAGSHDFSCTPHNLERNAQALLHRFQAQIIEKNRLTLAQQHCGQQHNIAQLLALKPINQVLTGQQASDHLLTTPVGAGQRLQA